MHPPTRALQVVTRAASPAGGCTPACQRTARAAFAALFSLSSTAEGRTAAAAQLRLCDPALLAEGAAPLAALFLAMAFDTAAMGSVPYPSSYFTGWLDGGSMEDASFFHGSFTSPARLRMLRKEQYAERPPGRQQGRLARPVATCITPWAMPRVLA